MHQESNPFQELGIFENSEINKAVDSIYQLLADNFGTVGENMMVCGSVAKVLHGTLAESYEAKDTDLLCRHPHFWRFLQANVTRLTGPEIEQEDCRIKLIYPGFLIEIWKERIPYDVKGIFMNKIHYCFTNK